MMNAHVGIPLLIACLTSVGLGQPAGPILAYQDSLGQYSFGYSAPGSARSEIRTIDGETRGSYSYIDDAGVIQSAQYIADRENGFRVAATSLPQAPFPVRGVQDTGAAAVTDSPEEVSEEKQRKTIGEGNIFLQGLKPVGREAGGLDGDLQAKEKAGVIQTDDEKLKSTSELESQAGVKVSLSDQLERSEVPYSEQIFETLRQSEIPVIRISQENLPIYPSIPRELINVQGSPITPASTVLKSSQEVADGIEKASSKLLIASVEERRKIPEQEQSTDPAQGIIAPVQILPAGPAYPTLPRYSAPPTLDYVFYNSQ